MTAITIKYFGSRSSEGWGFEMIGNREFAHAAHGRHFEDFIKRVSLIPMLVLGSKDVQVEPLRTDGRIAQVVMAEDGSLSFAESSTIVVDILHVHDDATQEDNDLVAKATLATIWGTLRHDAIRNPNSFVVQNGHTNYGWAEGNVSAAFAEGVVQILDEFWDGTPQEVSAEQLRSLYTAD